MRKSQMAKGSSVVGDCYYVLEGTVSTSAFREREREREREACVVLIVLI
jgi:hypothetical protein